MDRNAGGAVRVVEVSGDVFRDERRASRWRRNGARSDIRGASRGADRGRYQQGHDYHEKMFSHLRTPLRVRMSRSNL